MIYQSLILRNSLGILYLTLVLFEVSLGVRNLMQPLLGFELLQSILQAFPPQIHSSKIGHTFERPISTHIKHQVLVTIISLELGSPV